MSHIYYIALENNTGQFQDKCKFVTYAGANFLLHINNHTHVQSGGLNMIRWIVENWKQNDIMADKPLHHTYWPLLLLKDYAVAIVRRTNPKHFGLIVKLKDA